MTAKESLDSFIFSFAPFDDADFVEHLKRLLDQICKEQRELCSYHAVDYNVASMKASILNAPKPEL